MKGERVQTLGIEIAKGDLVLMSIDAFEKKRADFTTSCKGITGRV